MPDFVTFDDGFNYVSIAEIEFLGYGEGPNKGGNTWIKLRNRHRYHSSWSVDKIAEFLGPVINLHY